MGGTQKPVTHLAELDIFPTKYGIPKKFKRLAIGQVSLQMELFFTLYIGGPPDPLIRWAPTS